MDATSELAQPSLLPRAEALLLVDDEEAEIAEPRLLAAYGMRTDDDLHIARREPFSHRPRIGWRGQPGERLDPHPEPGETASKGLHVLTRQHRRRSDDRHLLAGECRYRGCAQCNLGFTKPDIAADEPVHRLAGSEVTQCRLDCLRLGLPSP
jgi:hypothetical protein